MLRDFRILALAVVLTGGTISMSAQQGRSTPLATPVEPIVAIVDAFRSHSVVAFSDAHGNRQLAQFELSVLRDPRIVGVVNDIVIENGNAWHQDAMDRYVRGEDVPCETLRLVWRETTQAQTLGANTCDIPERYRVVRDVNARLPRQRQLRVLLGDPPIDWSAVRTADDIRKWIELRDSHAAELIRREVLAKNRRAIVVYGQGHLQRKNLLANYESEGLAGTVISILESTTNTKVFSIWWFNDRKAPPAEVTGWPVPSLALTRGTTLGALEFTELEGAPPARSAIRDGKIVPVPREEWRTLRMENQFDAVLYLGKTSGTFVVGQTEFTPAYCADSAWLAELLRRWELGGPTRAQAARLREYCAARSPQ